VIPNWPEPMPRIAIDGDVDVARLTADARIAQAAWASQPLRARIQILRRFRHGIARHAEELAHTVRRPIAETLTSQILPLADHLDYLESNAESILAPRRLGAGGRPLWLHGTRTVILREPIGVVLILAPSNYPLLIPGTQLIQALAAGNAVLLKPSPQGRLAALALQRLLIDAGLEPNLLTLLPTDKETAIAAVRARPNKILLTGSSTTGREVLKAAADLLIPCVLELSGSDAVFVRADANVARTAAALRFGLYLNEGATCIAPRRVFVHRTLHDTLANALQLELESWPPIRLDPRQADKLRPLADDACFQGASRIWPVQLDWNQPVGPLVLSSAPPTLPLFDTDIFAPVVTLVPVDHDDDALAAAEQCPFALGASVFSSDTDAARQLAAKINAGFVSINDLIVPSADPRVPFGGRRASGFGVTRGAEGLLELTQTKVVAHRNGNWLPHLDSPQSEDAAFFAAALRSKHGQSPWERMLAAWETVRFALRRRRALNNLPHPQRTSSNSRTLPVPHETQF